jgi:hypothetical protein
VKIAPAKSEDCVLRALDRGVGTRFVNDMDDIGGEEHKGPARREI